MATSGVITSTMTVRQVGTKAMKELGLISGGETPTSDEMTDIIEAMNWMLKSWQALGCNLWREARTTATITGGTASVTLSPRPIDVISARHNMSATNERPLAPWTTAEYDALPNKVTVGNPSIYSIRKGVSGTTMYVWPVPATNQTIGYTYARVVEDVTAEGETLDVPQEWHETVWMCLAARLIGTFGAARLDPQNAARVEARAAQLEQALLDHDRPASIFMGAG